MVSGAVHAKATRLMGRPQRPREKRSLGMGLPNSRRQIKAAMQMVYEDVMAMIVSDTMALKPTTGPKLMREMTQVKAMETHTARRGTSKSWTYKAASVFCHSVNDLHGCAACTYGCEILASGKSSVSCKGPELPARCCQLAD